MDTDDTVGVLAEPITAEQATEIVEKAFNKRGVPPPERIEVILDPDADTPAHLTGTENHLTVLARNEAELRRVVGRYLLSPSWRSIDWLLATRPRLYVSMAVLLVVFFPLVLLPVGLVNRDLALQLSSLFEGLDVLFGFVLGYLVITRRPRLVLRLAREMADIDCVTEYDPSEYALSPLGLGVQSLIIIFSTCIGIVALVALLSPSDNTIPVTLFLVVAIVGLFFYCKAHYPVGENECTRGLHGGKYAAVSEALTEAFRRVFFSSPFREVLSEENGEFDDIEVKFRRTKFPQYRLFYDYVTDRTLKIRSCDISEPAAFRLGVATVVARSMPFYRDLSFAWRTISFLAWIYGLAALIAVMTSYAAHNAIVVVAAALVASAGFSVLWYKGFVQQEQMRRTLPTALRDSGFFNDYQVEFYSQALFPSTRAGDIKSIVGYHLMLLLLSWLIIATSGIYA